MSQSGRRKHEPIRSSQTRTNQDEHENIPHCGANKQMPSALIEKNSSYKSKRCSDCYCTAVSIQRKKLTQETRLSHQQQENKQEKCRQNQTVHISRPPHDKKNEKKQALQVVSARNDKLAQTHVQMMERGHHKTRRKTNTRNTAMMCTVRHTKKNSAFFLVSEKTSVSL